MQVHLQSKTGPLIPSGDDLLRSLREQTETLQSQWRDRLAHDPAGFAQLEVEIHDHFRRLADLMTASLLTQATTTHDQAEPGKKGVPTPPAADAPPNLRTLKLRLLGGLVVWITTIYCAPKAGTAKRRGQEGTGHYPELAALGIRKGATPALQSQVGRSTALLPSIELVRDELRQRGPTLDEKTVHRMARQLGAEVLTARTRQLQRYRDGQLPAGDDLVGRHVVAQMDGGRVRIRTQIETTKRTGGEASPQDPHRVARTQAPDPLSQRPTRPDAQRDAPWIDGTMGGPDQVMELLALHLHRLGVARAQKIFEWVGRDHCSISQVARRLKGEGVRTRTGLTEWDPSTIGEMLKNPAYKGTAAYGKTRAEPYKPQRLRPLRGKPEYPKKPMTRVDTPTEDQILIDVPALVGEDLFAAVQEQLEENRKRKRARAGERPICYKG